MPTTSMSFSSLIEAIGKDLTVDELRSALFDMGMELEEVEGDDIAVEVTAERLDLLSLQGLARALRSFLGIARVPIYGAKNSDYVVNISSKLTDVRPFTVCSIVKNLNLSDERIKEIIDVQEKLHSTLARGRKKGAIGIYPLEHITLPITFTADFPQNIVFQPLGSNRQMNGLEILQEHETGKEYAHLLEGKDLFPYFVDAANNILSMPPIINSEATGRVTVDTKDIFIECSGFDKVLLNELLTNLVCMFADMGGDIYSMTLNYEGQESEVTPKIDYQEKLFSTKTLKHYIGLDLSVEELKVLLEKMMYVVKDIKTTENGEAVFSLLAPAFRRDLWHEVDIAEDVARAYGYNNLPLTFPNVSTIGSTLELSDLREEFSDVMVGLGFLETYTFGLTAKSDQLDKMNLSEDHVGFVPVANGNETQGMMRISIIPEQLKSLANNRNQPLPQKIFEGDFVVLPDLSKDVKARNEMHLSAMITDRAVTFTQIKQVLDSLLLTRGINISIKPTNHPSFIKGRAGVIIFDDIAIGIIGELNPQVLINFGLTTPVAAFELNLESIL
ncbi:phenylalanine--tRNA ligase subunit beta [Candidatus Woesearchaeota archaeon]|nr:phenylalanine--tRNA ligase subunit beta [Candidatus Woesearchaeota archaeon]